MPALGPVQYPRIIRGCCFGALRYIGRDFAGHRYSEIDTGFRVFRTTPTPTRK